MLKYNKLINGYKLKLNTKQIMAKSYTKFTSILRNLNEIS